MAGYEDFRVFVGGLSWDTTDKSLEHAFRRFGKVVEAKVMLDRGTGRPRGFGFVTFTNDQCVEDAIAEMHNGELDGRIVSVNKAQPQRFGAEDYMYGGGGYSNGGGRSGYSRGGGGGGSGGGGGGDECFKCGKSGHWARECTFVSGGGGSGGGRFPPRYSGSGGGRSDRSGGAGGPGYGGRYGEKDQGGDRYGGGGRGRGRGRDRYGSDRYDDGYGGDGYERGSGRASARYGSGGPTRYEGSHRDRFGPYDRPSGRSYDDHY